MVSQIIIVMLGSAVCGQIAAQELSYAANLIQSRNFRAFEAFIVATAIYLRCRSRCASAAGLNWLRARASCSGAGDMVDFSLWDILRNLLLAARWTVLLSLIAFVGGGAGRAGAAGLRGWRRCAAQQPAWPPTCSCSRARRC
jgi:hypothetical protein